MLQDFVTALYTHFGYAGVLIAMAIESCCIPLPSELIMPLAGAATATTVVERLHLHQTFSLFGVTVAGAIGCVVGSVIAYAIGSAGGREALLRYGRFVLISRHDAERADAFFARHGDMTVLISRLLPIVRTFISLPAGITRMHFPRFVLFTFIGSLPWCFVLALIGQQLGEHWDTLGTWFHRLDILIGAVLLVLVGLLIRRHMHRTRHAA